MFRSKREEMAGDWIEHNDEDIHDYIFFLLALHNPQWVSILQPYIGL